MSENKEWCVSCAPTLGRMVRRHALAKCPLTKSSYCGLCGCYGHSPSNCENRKAILYRNMEVECIYEPSGEKNEFLLEITENDDALRAALTAAGVKPMICQAQGKKDNKEMIENKKRLQKLAAAAKRLLVFHREPSK